MKCFIGVGSNLGDRLQQLERAAQALRRGCPGDSFRASPVYQTPALVPVGAPQSWRLPFLNAVIEIEFSGSSAELLQTLKKIEADLGRVQAEKWAPREIDLDILLFGPELINENNLQVPHPGLCERAFVLDPLKDLAPTLCLPGRAPTQPVVLQARERPGHSPLWMGILNLTPDSFSDGGEYADSAALTRKIETFVRAGSPPGPGPASLRLRKNGRACARHLSFSAPRPAAKCSLRASASTPAMPGSRNAPWNSTWIASTTSAAWLTQPCLSCSRLSAATMSLCTVSPCRRSGSGHCRQIAIRLRHFAIGLRANLKNWRSPMST